MPRFLPALNFAFWTYFWTLGLLSVFILWIREMDNFRRAELGDPSLWWSPTGLWDDLQAVWFLPLPIFPAALLAFWLAPRWVRGLALLLTPLLLMAWAWLPYGTDADEIWPLMMLILPASLLASVPGLIRSRCPRLSSRHD